MSANPELALKPAAGLDAAALIAALQALRGEPRSELWWARYCAALAQLTRARAALIATLGEDGWKLEALHESAHASLRANWQTALSELAPRATEQGVAYMPQAGVLLAAVSLAGAGQGMALLEIPERERPQINELLLRARLVSDVPLTPAANDAGDFMPLLDLAARVMQEKRFGAALYTLVGGIAAQLRCDQVVIGWQHNGYVRALAISHLDRFERKTDNLRLIESALEEAFDQGEDIVFDRNEPPVDGRLITLAHQRLTKGLGFDHLATLVLATDEGTPQAVLLLANEAKAVCPTRLQALSTATHYLLPWLIAKHSEEASLTLQAWQRLKRRSAQYLGPEHIGAKLTALTVALLVFYSLIGTMTHHVEANGELVTDSTLLISAPFDGFVKDASATLGDQVKQGTVLGALDAREMMVQESEIRADLRRAEVEADRARAQGQTSEAEIAMARQAQAQARLARVQFYLQQANFIAPFDGVIVDGERKDLTGLPVRQGEKLFKIARIEGLYAMLHVPERDVAFVSTGATGELRLLGQPETPIPFKVETLIPVAQTQGQQGNQFLIKARLEQAPATTWRPGMSGMAKIDGGERNIAWILTHRVIDALRLKLWW